MNTSLLNGSKASPLAYPIALQGLSLSASISNSVMYGTDSSYDGTPQVKGNAGQSPRCVLMGVSRLHLR